MLLLMLSRWPRYLSQGPAIEMWSVVHLPLACEGGGMPSVDATRIQAGKIGFHMEQNTERTMHDCCHFVANLTDSTSREEGATP